MAVIRAIDKTDYAGWLPLWDGNNLGIHDEAVTKNTWARLIDPDFPVKGLIALENDLAVGLLHYVLHPTTGSTKDVCYMQDVYVEPHYRGKGIAKMLIKELARIGQENKNWARIYWLADAKNEASQALYRKLGVKLDFSLHVLPIGL